MVWNIGTYLSAYQLEGYELTRFFKLCISGKSLPITIVWTKKLVAVISMGFLCIIFLGFIVYIALSQNALLLICIAVFLMYLTPLIILLGHIIISPIQYIITLYIKRKTKILLQKNRNLTIIGITGSRGKTSVRSILTHFLSIQYRVLSAPGNINTPLGLAQFLTTVDIMTFDVFVVEMGAYTKGNIEELCGLFPPNIAILTALGNQHAERFGSEYDIVTAKMELYEGLTEDGVMYYDANSVSEEKLEMYFASHPKKHNLYPCSASNIRLLPDYAGIKFDYENTSMQTVLLSEYSSHQIILCIKVAQDLGVSREKILNEINHLSYTEHRLELIKNNQTNVRVIDDSYNGNEAGLRETMKILSQNNSRRKVYITPGIFELGEDTKRINEQLGKEFVGVIDTLVIIETESGKAFRDGYSRGGGRNILSFPNRTVAHASLGQFVKSGDIVIFQNDATDNY